MLINQIRSDQTCMVSKMRVMDQVTEMLQRRVQELEKMETYLQQQLREVETDREKLHVLSRKDKALIHDQSLRLQQLTLAGHHLRTQLTVVEQSERASHKRCADLEDQVYQLEDRLFQLQVQEKRLRELIQDLLAERTRGAAVVHSEELPWPWPLPPAASLGAVDSVQHSAAKRQGLQPQNTRGHDEGMTSHTWENQLLPKALEDHQVKLPLLSSQLHPTPALLSETSQQQHQPRQNDLPDNHDQQEESAQKLYSDHQSHQHGEPHDSDPESVQTELGDSDHQQSGRSETINKGVTEDQHKQHQPCDHVHHYEARCKPAEQGTREQNPGKQSLGEQSLGEQSFEEQGPEEKSFGEQESEKQSFIDHECEEQSFIDHESQEQSFTERDSEEQSFTEQDYEEQSFREQDSEEQSFREQGSEEQSFREQGSEEQSFRERDSEEQSFREQDSEEQSFTEQDYGEQSFREQDSEEQSSREQGSEEQSFREQDYEEQSFREQGSEEQSFRERDSEEQSFRERDSEEQSFRERDSEEQSFRERDSEEQSFRERDSEEQSFREQGSEEQSFREQGSEEQSSREQGSEEQSFREQGSEEQSFREQGSEEQLFREEDSEEQQQHKLENLCHHLQEQSHETPPEQELKDGTSLQQGDTPGPHVEHHHQQLPEVHVQNNQQSVQLQRSDDVHLNDQNTEENFHAHTVCERGENDQGDNRTDTYQRHVCKDDSQLSVDGLQYRDVQQQQQQQQQQQRQDKEPTNKGLENESHTPQGHHQDLCLSVNSLQQNHSPGLREGKNGQNLTNQKDIAVKKSGSFILVHQESLEDSGTPDTAGTVTGRLQAKSGRQTECRKRSPREPAPSQSEDQPCRLDSAAGDMQQSYKELSEDGDPLPAQCCEPTSQGKTTAQKAAVPEAPGQLRVERAEGSCLQLAWQPPLLDPQGCSNGARVVGYRIYLNGRVCQQPHNPGLTSTCIQLAPRRDPRRPHRLAMETLAACGGASPRVELLHHNPPASSCCSTVSAPAAPGDEELQGWGTL